MKGCEYMFKTKWQKKYEQAMENIEFWKNYHEERLKLCKDSSLLMTIHSAQMTELSNVLSDMRRIARS